MLKHFLCLLLCGIFLNALQAQNSPCAGADSIRIVVIGSSTAAGAGASPSDSSWVNRYRDHLQALNPGNEVINLARGGYNTWRLMPDYFSPPANRPSPDSLRNISHALRQNPDAIIINLPSNDATIGTGVNEQMSNFIHMDSLAQSQGVPVWICTTQPRNFSASQIQIQLDVRDSVLAYFTHRALDFWTGLANNQNTIDSTVNSGDGVHVNNLGHRILFQVAAQAALPDTLVNPLSGTDLKAQVPQWLNPSLCGDRHSPLVVTISNLGSDSLNGSAEVQLVRENLISQQLDTLRQTLSNLASCANQSILFSLNTLNETKWRLKARVLFAGDTISHNNESPWISIQTQASPSLSVRDTNLCADDSLHIQATGQGLIRWFEDAQLQNQVGEGDSLFWSGNQSDSLFLRAYKGPFFYLDKLQAASSHNIQWNGCMFNLIASSDTVFIDSIDFYSGNTGDLQVNIKTLAGSYIGQEGSPNNWSSALSDSVYGAVADGLYTLNFDSSLVVPPNDTLGVYLYLENPNQRLSYQSAPSSTIYQGPGLSLQAGTGVSHTFGSTFFPRHFRGSIYHHYGFKVDGQCQSEIDTLVIRRSTAQLNIGRDTTLLSHDSLVLRLPSGFSDAHWSDGSQTDSLIVKHQSNLQGSFQWIWLEARDSLGCLHRDSLQVFHRGISLAEIMDSELQVFPNPSDGRINIQTRRVGNYHLNLYQLNGSLLKQAQFKGQHFIWETHLPKGLYLLQMEGEHQLLVHKIQVQ